MNNIAYSIIIPHKNIPKLLECCLASIPLRYDLEVIIVDDNSDPNIVDFEHFPGRDRLNTTVIFDKSGKGAGLARNIGLKHAKGEWLIFADADDVFEPGFVQILELVAEDNDSDVVNFDVTSRNLEDNAQNDEIEKIGYHCNKKEYLNNPESFKYIVLTPWGKVIRRKFIEEHKLRYEEVPFGNDLYFATLVDFYCKKRRLIPIIGYCWMKRMNSLWRQENLEWAKIRFEVLLHSAYTMKSLGENNLAKRYFDGSFGFLYLILKYSKLEYLKALAKYGLSARNLHIILKQLPRETFYFSKEYIMEKLRTKAIE